MRWRGVSHVEFAVLDYDDSIAFYDALFGWLGYDSFSSLNMEYQSIYYFTRYINPHSYIGIQPSGPGEGSHTATRRSASITLRCGPVAAKRSTAFTVNSWSDAMFP